MKDRARIADLESQLQESKSKVGKLEADLALINEYADERANPILELVALKQESDTLVKLSQAVITAWLSETVVLQDTEWTKAVKSSIKVLGKYLADKPPF